MSDTDKEISAAISAEWARAIWHVFGRALGHGALMYGAHKSVNAFKTPAKEEPAPEGFFNKLIATPGYVIGKINPLTKFQKLFVWQVSEAAAHKMNQPLIKAWDAATPEVEKFLTPIIQSIVEPTLVHLKEGGYILLPEKEEVIPEVIPEVIEDPSTLSTVLYYANPANIFKEGVALTEKVGEWWSGTAPTEEMMQPEIPIIEEIPEIPEAPRDLIGRLGQLMADKIAYARENTGEAGEFIAESLGRGYQFTKMMHDIPGAFMDGLDAFCEESGCPFPLAVAGIAGTGLLAYIGVRALWNYGVSVTVSQNLENTNTNQNNIVVNVKVNKETDNTDDETPSASKHRKSAA